MKKWISLTFLMVILMACQTEKSNEKEIEKINVIPRFALFHKAFFTTPPNKIHELKKDFPYMFPDAMNLNTALHRRNDTLQQELFTEVDAVYEDCKKIEIDFTALFKHIKYYDKSFRAPLVVTDVTGISYNDRILYANDMLLLSLDMFLGRTHYFYKGFPAYLAETFTPSHLVVEAAKKIIAQKYRINRDRTFLGQMIFEGKKMYMLDLFLPKIADNIKLGYKLNKWEWAKENEALVWAYFVKKEMLYSNNSKLKKRFIDVAPFSKFYTSIDKKTPGEIAKYIGLQIVRAYVKNHKITVEKLMQLDAQILLNQSGFKPKK